MSNEEARIPQIHDRVTMHGRNGVFSVVEVDGTRKTAALQTVTGDGPVVPGVPWDQLSYMDEEDAAPASGE